MFLCNATTFATFTSSNKSTKKEKLIFLSKLDFKISAFKAKKKKKNSQKSITHPDLFERFDKVPLRAWVGRRERMWRGREWPTGIDRRPSRPSWRGQRQWGRRCVRTSLSWRCGCAAGRGARRQSGSPRSSKRSWCSPSRPGTRSRTLRRAPACAWRCSSGWQWLSADECPPWASALDTGPTNTQTATAESDTVSFSWQWRQGRQPPSFPTVGPSHKP